MELTTLEAIQYCLDEGIEGAEKRLQSYKRRGRIDNTDVLEAIRKDLQTLHVTVTFKTDEEGVVLKGKGRRFLLGEKLTERAKRLDNRVKNGAIRDDDRKILDEHIFRTTVNLEPKYWNYERDTVEITTTELIKQYALINPNEIEHKQVLKIIKENIFGEQGVVYAHSITEYIRGYIRDTNRNILTSSLKALEKADRIILTYRYFVNDKTGNNEVNEASYLMMREVIECLIGNYNDSNGTSFTLNTFQKIRAKEKRFLKITERDFFKYMEDRNDVTVYKKNVIRILNVESKMISKEQAKQVYADILLKRIKKHFVESSTNLEATFFERYRSFVLAKVIESFGVKLPEWCLEQFERYSAGFGEVQFQTDLLTEDEKREVGISVEVFDQERIESQLPF